MASNVPKGYPRVACKGCERPVAECGSLSARGLCQLCGAMRWTENLLSLMTHSGPYFDHWRRRCAASYGAVLLDDLPPSR